jgi:hypothetical protein
MVPSVGYQTSAFDTYYPLHHWQNRCQILRSTAISLIFFSVRKNKAIARAGNIIIIAPAQCQGAAHLPVFTRMVETKLHWICGGWSC